MAEIQSWVEGTAKARIFIKQKKHPDNVVINYSAFPI